MRVLVDNLNLTLSIAQTVTILLGFWPPPLKSYLKIFFHFYTFVSYMFINGSYIIIQVGYLYQVWGDVTLMTGASFLLFTNLALCNKIINVYRRQKAIQAMIVEANAELSAERRPEGLNIIKRNNLEAKIQLCTFCALSYSTIFGLAISAEKGELLVPAWYPYDYSTSPAYELTYAHQFTAVCLIACFNISLDTLVTSLTSQCRCRLSLLSLSLRTICDSLIITQKGIICPEADSLLSFRLCRCITQHQQILKQVAQLQEYFSIPIFGQFSFSLLIICVTAYQLALVCESFMWFFSMAAYMAAMLLQLFIYCYHGNKLVTESGKVADAVYECPWYSCSPRQRRCLMLVMVRAQREAKLKAGGLTELSLATFVSIVKASYTFFTVLKTVEDDPK